MRSTIARPAFTRDTPETLYATFVCDVCVRRLCATFVCDVCVRQVCATDVCDCRTHLLSFSEDGCTERQKPTAL